MPHYTVTHHFLEKISDEKKYHADVLMVFAQNNPFKVAIDTQGVILGIYESIGNKDQLVASWLGLMSLKPSSFEKIDADVHHLEDKNHIFLRVCKATKVQQKVIVYSHQDLGAYEFRNGSRVIFEGSQIEVCDRDQAFDELNRNAAKTINAYNSIIATGGSNIEEANSHG